MFEYRNLWSSVLRCAAGASLILLLTVGLGGLTATPAAAQVADSGGISVQIGTDGTTVSATGDDGDIDEWENDILNGGGGGAPATSAGLVDQMAGLLHRTLDWMGDLMGVTLIPSK